MDIIAIVHVLSVILWIGGEAFVTMVIFPTIQGIEDPIARMKVFMGVERRFSRLAKISAVVVGATGFWLFYLRGAFASLAVGSGLMLGYKLLVWLCFMSILFGGEKQVMSLLVSRDMPPEKALRRVALFHWVLMVMAGIATAFGVAL